jgi:hypothetical protein
MTLFQRRSDDEQKQPERTGGPAHIGVIGIENSVEAFGRIHNTAAAAAAARQRPARAPIKWLPASRITLERARIRNGLPYDTTSSTASVTCRQIST